MTYYGREKNKNFTIRINGEIIENVKLDGSKGGVFYTTDYTIPKNLLTAEMEVKFEAEHESSIANVYEVRLVK